MNKISFLFILFISLNTYGQTPIEKQLNSNSKALELKVRKLDSTLREANINTQNLRDSLQNFNQKLDAINSNINRSNNLTTTGNEVVSNQIASASYAIGIIGILLILLGFYFNRVEARVRKIDSDAKDKLHEIEIIQKQVAQDKFDIENNPYKIFRKVQEQQLIHLLPQLEDNPKFMFSFYDQLIGMEIPVTYFDRFFALKNEIMKTNIDYVTQLRFSTFMYEKFPFNTLLSAEYLLIPISMKKNTVQKIFEYLIENHDNVANRIQHLKSVIQYADQSSLENLKRLISVMSREEVNDWTSKLQNQDAPIISRLAAIPARGEN